jgi:hypothetical protein
VKLQLDPSIHPFLHLLTAHGRRRPRDRHIPRASLLDHSDSAFKHLLESGDVQALLNAFGHDHESFHSLVQIFTPVCDSHCPDVEQIRMEDWIEAL